MTKTYQRLCATTFVLAILVLFWGLGSMQLMSLNEGRRALVIKEMFASGNWLLPTQNGELYLTKPPFLYWLSMVTSSCIGQVTEWTVRLPSAIAGLATLWMTYRYVLKKFGAWPALFSVQLLIANVGFAMLARRAEIEMLLTALCVGALIAALTYIDNPFKRTWLYLSYALLGLALLTKGPVALLFVTLPLILAAIWTKDASIKKMLTDVKGWGLFLLIGLSWYAVVTMQLGFDIWSTIAKRDMLEKIQAAETAKPLLSYLGWIAVDFLLLVGLFFIRPTALFMRFAGKTEWKVLILAVAVPLLTFSLFSNKHAKYLLPIYPAMAILLGVQLGLVYEAASAKIKRLILTLGIILPIAFACFYMLIEPEYFAYRTAALSQFKAWDENIPENLYAFGDIDSRLIYYANVRVKILSEPEIEVLRNKKKSFLLLVEDENIVKASTLADCKIKEFKPYLKKKKSLIVYGFGDLCDKYLNKKI